MKTARPKILRRSVWLVFLAISIFANPVRAGSLTLPREATQAMALMYGGDPDGAIVIAQKLQLLQPDHPLGFILEAEADWWKTFCASSEIKYGMVDAWKRGKKLEDEAKSLNPIPRKCISTSALATRSKLVFWDCEASIVP
jgi:hypothetical protein